MLVQGVINPLHMIDGYIFSPFSFWESELQGVGGVLDRGWKEKRQENWYLVTG